MTDLNIAQHHTIWLRVQPGLETDLSKIVEELTRPTDSPSFVPHITLLGDIHGPPAQTVEVCRDALKATDCIAGRIKSLARGDAFFMSLFLDVTLPETVYSLREYVTHELGVHASQPYRPHISLAYGQDGKNVSPKQAATIEKKLVGKPFTIATLSVVASAKSVPIEEWRSLIDLQISEIRNS